MGKEGCPEKDRNGEEIVCIWVVGVWEDVPMGMLPFMGPLIPSFQIRNNDPVNSTYVITITIPQVTCGTGVN